jgi:hypothetical protein
MVEDGLFLFGDFGSRLGSLRASSGDKPRLPGDAQQCRAPSDDIDRRESESRPVALGKPVDVPCRYAATNTQPTRASAAPACRGQRTDRTACFLRDG